VKFVNSKINYVTNWHLTSDVASFGGWPDQASNANISLTSSAYKNTIYERDGNIGYDKRTFAIYFFFSCL